MTTGAAQILVVDRDARCRRLLEAVFVDRGHRCEWSDAPKHAANVLSRGEHDILIADVRCAGRDLELLRHARTLPSPPATVVLTTRASMAVAVSAFRLGAVDCLPKPVTGKAFAESLDRALARRRAQLAVHRAQYVIALCADWFQYLDDLLAAPGQGAIPSNVLDRLMPPQPGIGQVDRIRLLSHRERQVLKAIAAGLRPRDIASALNVSIHTARAHVKSIMRKTGAHSRAEITRGTDGRRRPAV